MSAKTFTREIRKTTLSFQVTLISPLYLAKNSSFLALTNILRGRPSRPLDETRPANQMARSSDQLSAGSSRHRHLRQFGLFLHRLQNSQSSAAAEKIASALAQRARPNGSKQQRNSRAAEFNHHFMTQMKKLCFCKLNRTIFILKAQINQQHKSIIYKN